MIGVHMGFKCPLQPQTQLVQQRAVAAHLFKNRINENRETRLSIG